MSQENVELVCRVYEGWERGDFLWALDVFHPDIEFELPDWPDPARARGVEAMGRAWRAALSPWEDFRAEPTDVIDTGQQIVAVNRVRARGRGSGVVVSADGATVWTMEAGKVVRLAVYWDGAKALKAVGLPEP